MKWLSEERCWLPSLMNLSSRANLGGKDLLGGGKQLDTHKHTGPMGLDYTCNYFDSLKGILLRNTIK